MAHKKGASSSRNGRDSNAQRLGVKRFGGQQVKAGETLAIIEAMKMEAAISATKDGKVERVAFTQPTKVEGGDLVVVIA